MSLPPRAHDSTLIPSRCGNAWRNAAMLEPAALQCEIGPTQSRLVLAADHQIDAAAPRVGIDKERVGRGLCKSGREQRGPRTAAACHHRDDRAPAPVIAAGFRGLRQRGDEFGFVGGQGHDVLGADGDRGLPFGGLRLAAAEQDDVAAAGQRGSGAAAGPSRVEQHGRCPGPGLPARRLGRVHHCHTRSGGDPVDVVAHRRSGDHGEDAVGCVHQPTVRAANRPNASASRDLWTRRRTVDRTCFNAVTENAVPQLRRSSPPIRTTKGLKKGRPPPGGEEAEVVVYQPRGVGLMHTRHKPSNPHYTHGKRQEAQVVLATESTR